MRRDVLLAHPGLDDPGWAEPLRLDLWLRRYEAGHAAGCRIPLILTHHRPDRELAPVEPLAGLVNAHLARTDMPLRVEPSFPLVVRCRPLDRACVSIVIPSRLRTPLVLRCILSVLRDLHGTRFELVVGVCQPDPLDAVQAAAAAQIAAVPQARVVHVPSQTFNFSQVCNLLAAMTSGPHILLLNDDVSVTSPGWLDEMAAIMADRQVGIVRRQAAVSGRQRAAWRRDHGVERAVRPRTSQPARRQAGPRRPGRPRAGAVGRDGGLPAGPADCLRRDWRVG